MNYLLSSSSATCKVGTCQRMSFPSDNFNLKWFLKLHTNSRNSLKGVIVIIYTGRWYGLKWGRGKCIGQNIRVTYETKSFHCLFFLRTMHMLPSCPRHMAIYMQSIANEEYQPLVFIVFRVSGSQRSQQVRHFYHAWHSNVWI